MPGIPATAEALRPMTFGYVGDGGLGDGLLAAVLRGYGGTDPLRHDAGDPSWELLAADPVVFSRCRRRPAPGRVVRPPVFSGRAGDAVVDLLALGPLVRWRSAWWPARDDRGRAAPRHDLVSWQDVGRDPRGRRHRRRW